MSNFDLTKYKKGNLQQNSIPIMAGLESVKYNNIKLKNNSKSKSNTSDSVRSKSKTNTSNSTHTKTNTSNSIQTKTIQPIQSEKKVSPAIKDLEKVPKENWLKIPIKNNIRYIRSDDNGRLHHGFLMRTTPDRYQLELGSRSIDDFRCKKWVINLDKVTDIYIKPATDLLGKQPVNLSTNSNNSFDNQKDINNQEDIDNTTDNTGAILTDYSGEINQLQDDVDQLKQELKRMSNEQKRILLLIQRLHSSEML